MDHSNLLSDFFSAIIDDPRIGASHICVYSGLLSLLDGQSLESADYKIRVFSHEVMKLVKISGSSTYHKSVNDLNDYGYIHYTPSHNRFIGSLVIILKLT